MDGSEDEVRRLAIVNAKGGTGKTTCTVNLAAALGEMGERVLVIDLDPQGSACDALGVQHSGDPGKDIREVVAGNAPPELLADLVRETSAANVFAVPASPRLEGLSTRDMAGAGRERLHHLSAAMETLSSERNGWGYVFFDTAPTIGPVQIAALAAAHEALIPLNPSPAALSGLQTAREAIRRIRQSANSHLDLLGILLCRVARTRLAADITEQLQRTLPGLVFDNAIRESVRVEEAHGWCRPVVDYDAKSSVAQDFRDVAQELQSRFPTTAEEAARVEDAGYV